MLSLFLTERLPLAAAEIGLQRKTQEMQVVPQAGLPAKPKDLISRGYCLCAGCHLAWKVRRAAPAGFSSLLTATFPTEQLGKGSGGK